MKKKVKSLIIAASVAAIAGIGAVSFAAWNTNVDTNVDATGGDLGNVAASIGFVLTGENTSVADKTLEGKLVPYNQPAGYDTGSEGEVQFWTVALDNYNVEAKAYKFTLTYATDNSVALEDGGSFYYSISDAALEAAPNALTNWTALGSDVSMEAPSAAGTVSGKYLNIVLDSSKLADMGKSGFKFTLTLANAD